MGIIFIKILFGSILLGGLSYLFGTLFLNQKLFKSNFLQFIVNSIIGSIILSSITAMVFLGFKTQMILCLPLLIATYFFRKKFILHSNFKLKENAKVISILFITCVLFGAYHISDNLTSRYKVPAKDHAFYISLGNQLSNGGNENLSNLNMPIDLHKKQNQLYHFFEIWLGVLIHKVTTLHLFACIIGIVFSLFAFYSIALFYLFIKQISKNSSNTILLMVSISMLFYRPILHYLFKVDGLFWDNIFLDGHQKIIYILPLWFAILYLYQSENFIASIIFSLFCIVLNPLIIFGIAGFWIVPFIMQFFNKYKSDDFKWLPILLIISSFIIALFLYLKFCCEPAAVKPITSLFGILHELKKVHFNYWYCNSIVWFICLYIAKRRNSFRTLLYPFFGAIIISSVAFTMLNADINGWQIFSTVSFLISFACIYKIWSYLTQNYSDQMVNIFGILFFILGIFLFYENTKSAGHTIERKVSKTDNNFVQKLAAKKVNNELGIRIINPERHKAWRSNPPYCGIYEPFTVINNWATVTLNIGDNYSGFFNLNKKDFWTEITRNTFWKSSGFFQFIQSNKMDFNAICIDTIRLKMQKAYITKYQPQFCLIDESMPIPAYIQEHISEIITDPITNDKVLFLKY